MPAERRWRCAQSVTHIARAEAASASILAFPFQHSASVSLAYPPISSAPLPLVSPLPLSPLSPTLLPLRISGRFPVINTLENAVLAWYTAEAVGRAGLPQCVASYTAHRGGSKRRLSAMAPRSNHTCEPERTSMREVDQPEITRVSQAVSSSCLHMLDADAHELGQSPSGEPTSN